MVQAPQARLVAKVRTLGRGNVDRLPRLDDHPGPAGRFGVPDSGRSSRQREQQPAARVEPGRLDSRQKRSGPGEVPSQRRVGREPAAVDRQALVGGLGSERQPVRLSRLDVVNTRLAKGGPYLLGTRFSLADFYLSFWVAWIMALDRDGVRKRLPSIAKLYELVRSRPSAAPYLDETERWSEDYADMMKKNPAGVVA